MFEPNMQMYFQIAVHDKNGKMLRKGRKLKAHSFCVQFMEVFRVMLSPGITQTCTDTGGVAETIGTPSFGQLDSVVGAGVVTNGIRLGTGTTAVTMGDNKLETEIAQGTSAGQLEHGASTVSTVSELATVSSVNATRVFTNSSGGTITLGEVGIYFRTRNTGAVNKFFMSVRDVLATTVPVLNTEVVTVTYTFKVTV